MRTPGQAVVPDPSEVVDEERLERARKRLGLSEESLARALGLTPTALCGRLASGSPGFRAFLEKELGLPEGHLKLNP